MPAGTVGTTVPVSVENACPNTNGSACGTSQQLFYQYVGPPTLTSLTPSTGGYAGATQVEIQGTGFTTATEVDVTVDGKTAVVPNPTVVSDSYLGFTMPISPTGLPGTASISVTTACGPSAPDATSCGTSAAGGVRLREHQPDPAHDHRPRPGGRARRRHGHPARHAQRDHRRAAPGPAGVVQRRGINVGTATTDGSGVATLTATLPSSLASAVYAGAVSATYDGNPIYKASQASTSLTVKTPEVVVWGIDGSVSTFHVQPPPLLGVRQVATGEGDAFALMDDGTVVAWAAAWGSPRCRPVSRTSSRLTPTG